MHRAAGARTAYAVHMQCAIFFHNVKTLHDLHIYLKVYANMHFTSRGISCTRLIKINLDNGGLFITPRFLLRYVVTSFGALDWWACMGRRVCDMLCYMALRKPPKQILGFFKNPETWNREAFETSIRNDIELSTGPLTASDEVLVGMTVLYTESFIAAHINIIELGYMQSYPTGPAISPWFKIRTECLDKIIKVLAELALVARGRPKLSNKVNEVDELFSTT